jgi:uncharacterized membrane protein YhaH (DUF805 family)
MGFGEAIATCLSKYFRFNGRARRSEYWWFVLFTILVTIAAGLVDQAAHLGMPGHGPIRSLASLLLLLPSQAVTVRRLHDTNNSGFLLLGFYVYVIVAVFAAFWLFGWGWSGDWMGPQFKYALVLLGIAFVYALWLFVLTVLKGTDGPNKYGEDPLKAG